MCVWHDRAPQMGWSMDSCTLTQEKPGPLTSFHITEPQLSTAGPATSFLFHLPPASLLTNSCRNRATPSGFPVPEGLPQQPGNADHISMRGGGRARSIYYHTCKAVGLLAATLSAGKNQPGSSYSGLRVFSHVAHTLQVTGL